MPSKAPKLERFSLFDEPINVSHTISMCVLIRVGMKELTLLNLTTQTGTNTEHEEEKRKEKEKLERQYTMYLGQDRNGPPKAPWYLLSKEERDESQNQANDDKYSMV